MKPLAALRGFLARVREQGVRVALGCLVLGFFLLYAAHLVPLGVIDQLEYVAYDSRLALTMPKTVDPRIVIVDIDERSLAAEGRWPWSRNKLADFVDRLFDDYGAALLAFDVVFAEKDDSSGLAVLERLAAGPLADSPSFGRALEKIRPELDYDAVFADAVAGRPVILGHYFNLEVAGAGAERTGMLPAPVFVKGMFAGKPIRFLKAGGYGANLPRLQRAALTAGHFNTDPDRDGKVRRVPMLVEYDGAYYGALSLQILRVLTGAEDVVPIFGQPLFATRGYSGLEWLKVGRRRIPVDERAQTLIPFRGRQGSFPYVSATDVLGGTADRDILEGAIVFVGTTAPGLQDLRATPVQKAYPGVEAHANLVSGMLDGRLKEMPAFTVGAEIVLLVVFGGLFAVLGPTLSPAAATALGACLLAGYTALNLLMWSAANLVLPLASGLVMLLAMYLVNMSYGYFIETRGKRALTQRFGSYIPPELVTEMAREPEHYSMEARSKELTVLFSDVRGFSSIAEGLPPKELSELMNLFLTPMTYVIHQRRGTIDKYMGDAIMAFWGAPLEDDEHALHAVDAAFGMLTKVEEINRAFTARRWPSIRIGIGINTGSMSVGDMGSEFRRAYTVLGDSVNLGSRLESLTRVYGVYIIVSEATKVLTPEYRYRELDRVRVKGKAEPVTIFEPLGLKDDLPDDWIDELKRHKQALACYRAAKFADAKAIFLKLAKESRSPALYEVYLKRIAAFERTPPPKGWDGVYNFKHK